MAGVTFLGWNRLLPITVLVVGLVASVGASIAQAEQRRDGYHRAFTARSELTRSAVQERLNGIEDSLHGIRSSMLLLWPVDRPTFRNVTDVAGDLAALRAVQALTFDRAVAADDVAAYEAAVAADDSIQFGGYPDFRVRPAETAFDTRYIVEYLEPMFGNESAFGFDVGSEPARRAALELARDRGEAVATAPVTLVQETGSQRSILLLLGVYDSGSLPTTEPARRRHFVGAVSTLVRIGDLLDDVLGTRTDLDLEIYDVGITEEPALTTLDEDQLLLADDSRRLIGPDGSVTGIHDELDINVGGRRWRLLTAPNERFQADLGAEPWAVGMVGVVLTLLAAGAVTYVAGEQRRAEQLVEQRTADLRQLIVEAPDATLVVDSSGVVRLASNQVREVLGYLPEEVVGQRIELLIPEDSRSVHIGHRAAFSRAPSARAMRPRGALRARHRSGREIPVEVNLAPIGDGDVIASVRDVSIREQARRELERSNEQKAAFLGTISHELRTPLTAIRAFVRLLLDPDRDFEPSVRNEFLERVARNTESLHTLIEEVLEFSLLERNSFAVEAEAGDLAEVVAEVLDEMSPAESLHHVERHLQKAPCALDRVAVHRIVSNLLTNAWRYSPDGTVVSVTVRPELDGGAVMIVDDEGPGVPEADRDRVFERFWRGSNATRAAVPGTGIGLAVVAELTSLMHGTAEVRTAPTGGARFVVTLPAATTPSRAPLEESSRA